jgi:serine/threonine protein kinase
MVLMANEKEGFPITALREVKILMLLNHKNVLSMKEICHAESGESTSIYMVFEFLEHDLGGLLNRQVNFIPAEVMCLSQQMFEGLHYMHQNLILHRDMKVANLLVSDGGVLKIADFGLARGYDKNNSKYTSTVCTRWYRPPEILLGERNYTESIDIWGAGCIVAELFVGRPILRGGKPENKTEGENDLDQYLEICKLCGTPSEAMWKGFDELPWSNFAVPKETYPNSIRKRFISKVKGIGSAIPFIERLLTLDPKKRPSASEALDDLFFWGGAKGDEVKPCEPKQIRKFPSSHEFTVVKPPSSAMQQQQHQHQHHQQHGGRGGAANRGGAPHRGGAWIAGRGRGGGGPSSYARQQPGRGGGGGGGGQARPSVWAKKSTPTPEPGSVPAAGRGASKPSVWAKKPTPEPGAGGAARPSVWSKHPTPPPVAAAARPSVWAKKSTPEPAGGVAGCAAGAAGGGGKPSVWAKGGSQAKRGWGAGGAGGGRGGGGGGRGWSAGSGRGVGGAGRVGTASGAGGGAAGTDGAVKRKWGAASAPNSRVSSPTVQDPDAKRPRNP